MQIGRIDADSQFLLQLSRECHLRLFIILQLAAGKLPEAGHFPAFRALLQQYPSIRTHQCGSDHKQQCRIFFQFCFRCKDFVNGSVEKRGRRNPRMNWNQIMLKFFRGIVKAQDGATAVEYGLIVSLIVVAIIGAMNTVADLTINMWNGVSENIVNATD